MTYSLAVACPKPQHVMLWAPMLEAAELAKWLLWEVSMLGLWPTWSASKPILVLKAMTMVI